MTDALELTQADIEKMRADDEEEEAEEEEAAPDALAEAAPDDTPAPEPVAVDPDKIERAVKTYMGAIAKAFGDASDQLQPCTHCSGELLGFEPVQPPWEPRQAPFTEPCPICEGECMFRSGAKQGEFVLVSCERCNGKGYVPKTMDVPTFPMSVSISPATPPEPYPGYGLAFVPVPNGAPDPHGRPAGHPHWGMPRDYSGQAA